MLEPIAEPTPITRRRPVALKHFPYEINVNLGGGYVFVKHAHEALGLFLTGFWHALGSDVFERVQDEAYEFEYKGLYWRATFVLVHDQQAGRKVPFRIDLDFIRRVN